MSRKLVTCGLKLLSLPTVFLAGVYTRDHTLKAFAFKPNYCMALPDGRLEVGELLDDQFQLFAEGYFIAERCYARDPSGTIDEMACTKPLERTGQ